MAPLLNAAHAADSASGARAAISSGEYASSHRSTVSVRPAPT